MSETAAAVLILPMLVALVILLEGTRLGCTYLVKRHRARKSSATPISPDMLPDAPEQLQVPGEAQAV